MTYILYSTKATTTPISTLQPLRFRPQINMLVTNMINLREQREA